MGNLVERANSLPKTAWTKLARPPQYAVKTVPRRKPANVKRQVIRAREFLHLELQSEELAEFAYSPTACKNSYRLIVVKKNSSKEKGEDVLFDEVRYFFDITNDRKKTAAEVVFTSNDRCDQENLIAQLSGGVRSLAAPVDRLVSNWTYMVMTSLAWTLKAWSALLLPVSGRWQEKHQAERRTLLRMEFKTFVNAFMKVPSGLLQSAISRPVLAHFLTRNKDLRR